MLLLGIYFFNVKVYTYSPFIILMFFLYSFLLSMGFEYSAALRLQLMLLTASLFLIYYIKLSNVNMDEVVVVLGWVMCISTLVLIYSVAYNKPSIYNLFETYGSIAVGKRDVGNGMQDFFRLGGVPFLFITFSVLIRRLIIKVDIYNSSLFVLTSFCIIISSTRSILIGCLLILAFLFARKYKILSVFLSGIGVVYVFIFYNPLGGFFDVSDFGNSIKLKDAGSFVDWANSTNILFGEGLGSLYFSAGRGYLVAQTEITLLDNIRYFGVIITFLLYLSILFPSFRYLSFKVDSGFYFAVMCIYMLMSLTNPMLFNSFGFIVILWYWSNVLNIKMIREY